MSGCCEHDNCATDATPSVDPIWRRTLWIALFVNAGMFAAELVAGLVASSSALQADALDFFADAANYAISLGVAGMGLAVRSRTAFFKGLTLLLLGAWVNADPRDTEAEIRLLIETARAYPDVVRAVLVGNETLLRREVTAAQLARLIERVRDNVPQPVSYADVWEFWLRHPEIAPAVDFLTVHLLPYWEDEPKGIDSALDEAARVHDEFVQRFAPKDILIGETGWPSQGRQRETAVPSPLNQARFIRGFVQQAEAQGWRYNLIEAFDQPWKRRSEGTVGGYWGGL